MICALVEQTAELGILIHFFFYLLAIIFNFRGCRCFYHLFYFVSVGTTRNKWQIWFICNAFNITM